MEIANLIVSILSMIGTVVSAIAAFSAKSEVKKLKLKIKQEIIGNDNNQLIGDIINDR